MEGAKIIKTGNVGTNGTYRSRVTVYRSGEIILPVELLITFENGKTKLEKWSGEERSKSFVYDTSSKIISAQIDPENKILLDINLNNNSKTLKKEQTGVFKYISKFLFRLQNILQTVSFFI